MITTLDAEKAFDKIQQTFIAKVHEISGNEGVYMNLERAIYSK